MTPAKYFVAFYCTASLCHSQLLLSQAKGSARSQIAMLSGVKGGCAAGIIVGFDAARAYIATAAHVIPDLSAKPLPGVIVRLEGGLDRNGTFLPTFVPPGKGDLAVVTIPKDEAVDRFLSGLDFALLSPDSSIPKDARVYSVGCSGGGRWNTGNNETFRSAASGNLVFDSDVAEGQSGGGLFNSGWELVGMPFEAGSNGVQAHPISEVLNQVRAWKAPVNLKARAAANRTGDSETVAQEARAVNLATQAESLLDRSETDSNVIAAYAMSASRLATPRQTQVLSDAWNAMQRVPFLRLVAKYVTDPFGNLRAIFPSARADRGVSVTLDGTAVVWDSDGKNPRIQIKQPASGLAVAPDGTIATFGKNNDVVLWSTADGRMLDRFTASSTVTSAAFSPDGRWLVLESDDNTVQVWNRPEPAAHSRFNAPGGPHRLQICAGGQLVGLAGTDGDLRIVSGASGSDVAHISAGADLADFAFVPDCTQVVTMQRTGAVRILGATSGSEIATIPYKEQQPASVSLSPDGMSAVIVPFVKDPYDPFVVRVLSLVDQREVSWLNNDGGGFNGADFTMDGKGLLLGTQAPSGGGSISFAELYALDLGGREDLLSFSDGKIKTLAFDSAGKQIGIVTASGRVKAVSLEGGRSLWDHDYGAATRSVFSLDGSQVAIGGGDGTVRVVRLQDESQRAAFKIEGGASDLAFDPSGETLFAAGADGNLYTLDIPRNKATARPMGDGCGNGCLKANFSLGGKWLFFVNDTFAGLQNVGTGEIVSRFNWKYFDADFDAPSAIAVTPDRERSAVVLSQRIAILRTGGLPPLDGDLILRPHEPPEEVDVAVDGDALSFSPNGKFLAVGSPGGIIRILQMPSGQELVRVNAGPTITAVAIADSGRFAAGDERGRVRVWNLAIDSMRKRLCDSLGSNLSIEQWRNNLYLSVQPRQATCDNWPAQ